MAIDTYISITKGNAAVGSAAASNPGRGHDAKKGSGAIVGDMVLAYDSASVGTRSRLREMVNQALFQVECGSTLTP